MDEDSCVKCHSKIKNVFFAFNFVDFILKIYLINQILLGALSYTAPEIFESGQYTVQSDIYSLGCVVLDMITCDTLTVRNAFSEKFCE
jgi:serine/threonine protein kinase